MSMVTWEAHDLAEITLILTVSYPRSRSENRNTHLKGYNVFQINFGKNNEKNLMQATLIRKWGGGR